MESNIPKIDVRDIDTEGYQKEIIIGADLHDAVVAYHEAVSGHLKTRFEESATNKEYWDTAYKARQETLTRNAMKETSIFYVLDNRPQIREYLREHHSLVKILADGSLHIHRIFGQLRKPHLELFRDPEEGWETLLIKIPSSLSIKENIRLIQRFRHEWLFNIESEDDWDISALVEPHRNKEEEQ